MKKHLTSKIKEKMATGTQTELDPNVHEAILLARDVLQYYSNDVHHQIKFRSLHTDALLQLVYKILEKHRPVYIDMAISLLQTQPVKISTLKIICDEVFGGEWEKNISWGRIIALYALCAELSHQCKEYDSQGTTSWVALYACDFIATYTGEKASQWIQKQGGWGALKFASQPKNNLVHIGRNRLHTVDLSSVALAIISDVLRMVFYS